MKNKAIRERLTKSSIHYWELAERIGVSESTLTRWLRQELDGERSERVRTALEELENERA